MLRRFVYLDHVSLNQYVTALEGGLTKESTKRSLQNEAGRGEPDLNGPDTASERSRENEESRTYAETQEAQFDRLLKAAEVNPEGLAWVEMAGPNVEFAEIRVGTMVSWECDLYVPQIIQSLSSSGEARDALNMMQDLLPSVQRLGLDTEGLPSTNEIETTSTFLSKMDAKLLVVGEEDVSDWRVAGQVNDDFLHAELEGTAHIVGKVSKVLPENHSKPYLTFPGMNLVPREQRRKMERQAPPEGQEEEYLVGPALMLDILAIYR